MKVIERVIKSAGSPGDNDLWLKEEGDNLSLRAHHNGGWKTVAGGESGGDAPKPIVLSNYPSDERTQADLDKIGLTFDEMEAAARGERTGVVVGNSFYTITEVSVTPNLGSFSISFYQVSYDETGEISRLFGYHVEGNNDQVIVTETDA